MRNKAQAAAVARLLQAARYEVLPTASVFDQVVAHVPRGRTLTVTASPGKGLETTLAMTERLAAAGYDVVPHLAARMVSGRKELEEIVPRMQEAGVRTVFVPGGDADPPAGEYSQALDLLLDLHDLGQPFAEVGITGYPESHPTISDDLTIQSMWDKRRYATQVVSNLTFDAKMVATWVARMRRRGITMPLLIGIPGPVDRAKLLTMATRIGVGDSTRFLKKHMGTMARLGAPGGFTGERFLEQCAALVADPTAVIGGLHVYTFNQVAQTEAWRTSYLAELGVPVPEA